MHLDDTTVRSLPWIATMETPAADPVADGSPAERLAGLAASAAAELPAAVARLHPAADVDAHRAAAELSAAVLLMARRLAGASRQARHSIAGLAVELAEQVNLLALHAIIEATIARADAPLPDAGERRERAARDLARRIEAVHARLAPAGAAC